MRACVCVYMCVDESGRAWQGKELFASEAQNGTRNRVRRRWKLRRWEAKSLPWILEGFRTSSVLPTVPRCERAQISEIAMRYCGKWGLYSNSSGGSSISWSEVMRIFPESEPKDRPVRNKQCCFCHLRLVLAKENNANIGAGFSYGECFVCVCVDLWKIILKHTLPRMLAASHETTKKSLEN